MKRKHPITTPQFLISRPSSSRFCSQNPYQTITPNFLKNNRRFFRRYTYYKAENTVQRKQNEDDNSLRSLYSVFLTKTFLTH